MFAVAGPRQEVNPAEAIRGEAVCVLAISPHADDHVRLHEIFRKRAVKLYRASTWREASQRLARDRPQVVICEAALPDADWTEVVGVTAWQRDAPRVIVISRLADESLWAAVLNLGGYDVLSKPLAQEEVVRVVGLAWQNWTNERRRRGKQPETLLEKENSK